MYTAEHCSLKVPLSSVLSISTSSLHPPLVTLTLYLSKQHNEPSPNDGRVVHLLLLEECEEKKMRSPLPSQSHFEAGPALSPHRERLCSFLDNKAFNDVREDLGLHNGLWGF